MRHILHPTDFSNAADAAAAHALDLVVRTGATLHVLHVVHGEQEYASVIPKKHEEGNIRMREALSGRLSAFPSEVRGRLRIIYELVEGRNVEDAIVEYAARHAIDLIVLGVHGERGLKKLRHLVLGSTAEGVMQKAPCPVLAVHAPEEVRPEILRVIVPVDFSEPSEQVVLQAKHLAARYGASVALLFVAEEHLVPFFSDTGLPTFSLKKVDDEIVAHADDALRELDTRTGGFDGVVTYTVRRGDPIDEIIAFAREQEASMIAMATHGFGPVERGLLGSVTERVVRLAPCPVWTVNPQALTPATGRARSR